MMRNERLWMLVGAAAVLIERLVTLQPRFANPLEASFGRSLVGFNPFLHQPPPPGYPLFVGLGKFVNFFVHDPLDSLLTLSVIGSIVAFAFLAKAFPDAIGYALALGAGLTPLIARPLPDSTALAWFAVAVWASRTRRNAVVIGVAAAATVCCLPQTIAVVVLFLLILERRSPVWLSFGAMLLVGFLQTIQNIEVRRLQAFMAANMEVRRTFDPVGVISIAIILLFAILFRRDRPEVTNLAGDPNVQRRGEH